MIQKCLISETDRQNQAVSLGVAAQTDGHCVLFRKTAGCIVVPTENTATEVSEKNDILCDLRILYAIKTKDIRGQLRVKYS